MKASLECYTYGMSTNSTPFTLNMAWQDKVPNTEVLERANLPSMYSLLTQRRLRWLGNVCRMEEGRISKDIPYGEMVEGNGASISDRNCDSKTSVNAFEIHEHRYKLLGNSSQRQISLEGSGDRWP